MSSTPPDSSAALSGRPNRQIQVYAERVRSYPDDFWRQTFDAERGAADRPRQLVDSIASELALHAADVLVDLGCANGALTDLVFDRCAGGLGVDISEALIEVARARFERHDRRYHLADLCYYAATEPAPRRFTKALCYGVFQYLWPEDGKRLLQLMHERFVAVDRLLLGSLPDRDRVSVFLDGASRPDGFVDNPETNLGIWRTGAEIIALGRDTGWKVMIASPPDWRARFRYDALCLRE